MKVSSMKLVTALMVTVWLLFALPNPDKAAAVVQTSSSITLNVYDSRESPVYNAKVVISSTSLPVPITIHSNQYGVASITYLPVGEYDIDISASYKGMLTLSDVQLSEDYTNTVTLEDNYSSDIENFRIADFRYAMLNEFAGFIEFYIHGEVPNDTIGRLAFYNDDDVIVGTPFKSDITINLNGFNSIDVPITSIPSGATKIGIELVSGQNQDNLVAKKTKKMWKQQFYEPIDGEFIDNNPYIDVINGSLKWYGASDETGIEGYSVFYVIKNTDYTEEEHFIGALATRADKSYQISVPALPNNVSNLVIKAVLESGEEVGYPKSILISDNRLSDSVTAITYSLSLPVPNLYSTYINYTSPATIQGILGWNINQWTNQLKGQSIYFVDTAGNKIQAIRTIKLPRYETYSYLQIIEPLTVPNGATRLAVYTVSVDGEESSPAYYTLPTYIPHQPPYNPNVIATHLKFQDWDATAGRIHGYLTWNKAIDETEISGYYAFFAGTGVQRTPIGQAIKGSPMTLEISPSTPVPQGVTEIQVIGYKSIDGVAHLASSWSFLSLNDYSTEEQVKAGLKYNYFTGSTAIDIEQILLTVNNPSNPFSQISKEDTQLLLSLIEPMMSHN
jgi:hypothetical protein